VSFDEGLAVGLALGRKKFSGGSDDKWTYPADWIQIPSPASNEVYCVGTISLSTNRIINVIFGEDGVLDDSATIDWGDGTIVAVNNTTMSHTYVDGTGHLTDSGMEQFLIKITMTTPSKWGDVRIERSTGANVFALAMSFGGNAGMPKNTNTNTLSLHQIQLPNITDLTGYQHLRNCLVLKKVITPTKITVLGEFAFYYDRSLETFDFSEVTTIARNAMFGNNRIAKLDFPKLTTISNDGIKALYGLREINAPLLTSVGDYGLQNNESLLKFTYADGCTFGTHATQNCYNLFPNPAP